LDLGGEPGVGDGAQLEVLVLFTVQNFGLLVKKAVVMLCSVV
jgi:hypothetical protein